MRLRHIGLPFALAVLMAASVEAQVPELTGRVVDDAGILSDETERLLTMMLESHEGTTGNQIAVLTIPSLGGEAVESYSLRVARAWALGTSQNDNGVLLLIAVNDREMRIEVGFGLEGVLTDSRASRIIRGDMRTYFRQGDFDEGVMAGVAGIIGVLDGTYEPPAAADDDLGAAPFFLGILFMIIPGFFMIMGILTRGPSRWFMFFFLIPFFLIGGTIVTGWFIGGWMVVALYAIIYIGSGWHPKIKKVRKGETVSIGPFTTSGFTSSSSGGGGGWSSSSGGSSFSGGGGSFGGGGASGGW